MSTHFHLLLCAKDRFVEFECQIFPEIGASLYPRTAALLTEEIAVDTVLSVRPTAAPEHLPWIQLVVANKRWDGDRWNGHHHRWNRWGWGPNVTFGFEGWPNYGYDCYKNVRYHTRTGWHWRRAYVC